MSSSNNSLNVPDFWTLEEKTWRNITKYDFRFYYQSGCTASREQAHQAYSNDIREMLRRVKINSNSYKALVACKKILEESKKNHLNNYFWSKEISNIAKIASADLQTEKELEVLQKMTVATALRSYNGLKNDEPESSTATSSSNNSSIAAKRKHEEEEETPRSPRKGKASTTQPTPIIQQVPTRQLSVSKKFKEYKQKILLDAATSMEFSIETNLPELIALKDVMLLKPSQFNGYTRSFFSDEVLNSWYKEVKKPLNLNVEEEGRKIARSIEDLMHDLKRKKIKTRAAVQELTDMSKGKEDHEAQLLIGLSNLIQKLPSKSLLPSATLSETELWSSVFDPVISALFTDPDRDTFLRWTNAVPEEGSASEAGRVQPDAVICQIDQLSWGCKLGYGEVKVAEATTNIAGLAKDLLRLAAITSNAAKSSKMRSILSFQIHGYNMKVYITEKMAITSTCTMVEVLDITFPKSIQEVDSFTNRSSIESLVSLYKLFWDNCHAPRQEQDNAEEPESPSLDLSIIQSIRNGSFDRSRDCQLNY